MAAKVKVEKPELSPGAARRRLDAVLEQLLLRGGREPLEEEPGKGPGEPPAKEASPSAPGKRPPGRFPQQRRKKRREGGEGPEAPPQKHNSFVIRLFDRSVELGQFPAGTPLYPVCRAWIGHCPAPAPPPEQFQAPPGAEDVLSLPPPGPALAPRVPSPLGPDEGAAPPDQVLDPAPSITSLIYKNMDRWKRVRQRWREAAQRQQQRYGPSLRLLRIIYERQ
ncbi:protein lin-37 homolog [Ammospiza caudacuta]|uniref:protein lin-37 homolog n=1 Tax=Ammospiza caudacuta TaxID=2857398 RepID=UPI002738F8E3|nr:protein lin-37 homolog [Ammospiza caudacuta]